MTYGNPFMQQRLGGNDEEELDDANSVLVDVPANVSGTGQDEKARVPITSKGTVSHKAQIVSRKPTTTMDNIASYDGSLIGPSLPRSVSEITPENQADLRRQRRLNHIQENLPISMRNQLSTHSDRKVALGRRLNQVQEAGNTLAGIAPDSVLYSIDPECYEEHYGICYNPTAEVGQNTQMGTFTPPAWDHAVGAGLAVEVYGEGEAGIPLVAKGTAGASVTGTGNYLGTRIAGRTQYPVLFDLVKKSDLKPKYEYYKVNPRSTASRRILNGY